MFKLLFLYSFLLLSTALDAGQVFSRVDPEAEEFLGQVKDSTRSKIYRLELAAELWSAVERYWEDKDEDKVYLSSAQRAELEPLYIDLLVASPKSDARMDRITSLLGDLEFSLKSRKILLGECLSSLYTVSAVDRTAFHLAHFYGLVADNSQLSESVIALMAKNLEKSKDKVAFKEIENLLDYRMTPQVDKKIFFNMLMIHIDGLQSVADQVEYLRIIYQASKFDEDAVAKVIQNLLALLPHLNDIDVWKGLIDELWRDDGFWLKDDHIEKVHHLIWESLGRIDSEAYSLFALKTLWLGFADMVEHDRYSKKYQEIYHSDDGVVKTHKKLFHLAEYAQESRIRLSAALFLWDEAQLSHEQFNTCFHLMLWAAADFNDDIIEQSYGEGEEAFQFYDFKDEMLIILVSKALFSEKENADEALNQDIDVFLASAKEKFPDTCHFDKS